MRKTTRRFWLSWVVWLVEIVGVDWRCIVTIITSFKQTIFVFILKILILEIIYRKQRVPEITEIILESGLKSFRSSWIEASISSPTVTTAKTLQVHWSFLTTDITQFVLLKKIQTSQVIPTGWKIWYFSPEWNPMRFFSWGGGDIFLIIDNINPHE